jgi:hypothetical protein
MIKSIVSSADVGWPHSVAQSKCQIRVGEVDADNGH